MCGISGIVNSEDIGKNLFNSIKHLEYRGYDSCGIAIMSDGVLDLRKNVGGIDEANSKENFDQMKGCIGIAHTRWATHGGVNRENAHPHLSNNREFAIVHNGIISNYQELREKLKNRGVVFKSMTDTEVFVNLIEESYLKNNDLEKAFLSSIGQINGSFSIVLLSLHDPEHLYCVKNESPLLLGIGEGCNYVGSDLNAFSDYTKKAIVLDDGEYVVLGKNNYRIRKVKSRESVDRKVLNIEWDLETSKKGAFSHYMLKEIFDEPYTIRQALKIPKKEIVKLASMLSKAESVFLIGVGTTFYVSSVSQYYFSNLTGKFFSAISSDEFSVVCLRSEDMVLAFSQSGETYDTKTALELSKSKGAKTAAIVNVMGSAISMLVDQVLMQGSGPEICVVSTKAALSQTFITLRIALELGFIDKIIDKKAYENYSSDLESFPEIIEQILNEQSGYIRNIARSTSYVSNWLFLGCGIYYPVAMESALKMKEVTYQHAEGMPAGFLKHGTLSMVDTKLYSLFFVPLPKQKELHSKTLIAMEQVKARGGHIVSLMFHGDQRALELTDDALKLPEVSEICAPMVQMIIAQMFAYYAALDLGRNIDKPRNLAKSVTVG